MGGAFAGYMVASIIDFIDGVTALNLRPAIPFPAAIKPRLQSLPITHQRQLFGGVYIPPSWRSPFHPPNSHISNRSSRSVLSN